MAKYLKDTDDVFILFTALNGTFFGAGEGFQRELKGLLHQKNDISPIDAEAVVTFCSFL